MASTRKSESRSETAGGAQDAGAGSSSGNPFGSMPGMPSMDDLTKLAERFKLPGVDLSAIVDWQRKDLEALAEANREAYEGMRALAQRRYDMLRESLQRWQDAMKEQGTGGEAWSKRAEQARGAFEQAMQDFRELAEMEAESRNRAWKVLQDRLQDNITNIQKLLQPKS